ncbi:MAG: protein kinase [Planctomycetes bacterium]|nr:protein kinase [Planctomycetota bacterium]MCB9892630.1 protein kinase [Planctomycetota bacterium]MCB9917548.1 protein kinase [Planctomycetota bacterium]
MVARGGRERKLGEFRIVRELGRGGMGVVFEAIQESLGRKVALKVLPSHISLNRGALERFRREAMSASKLSHPAIAQVYSVGKDQDLHYFAMELVEGPSLEKTLEAVRGRDPGKIGTSLLEAAGFDRGTWLPPSPHEPFFAASAAWIAEIAEALTSAHNARVLHRDLKPSNIIVRRDGSPVLVDFGLSQDSMETGLTRTGDAVGTPAYMSPEQATGAKDLDGRVDVYGLGATLYELITLRPPFTGANAPVIMQKILDEEVVDPCKINSACPRDLATIVLTCLQKRRDDRYRSARELAVDLRNFLRGESITAKAPTAGSKIRRGLVKRRKTILASAVTTAALAVLTAGFLALRGGLDIRSGEEELSRAISALQKNEEADALEAFSKARDLLGDARVREAWLDQLSPKIEDHLRRREGAEVTRLLNSYAIPYSKDERVVLWMERAIGRGIVRVKLDPPDARLTVRQLNGDAVIGNKVVLAGERLAAGSYLFELDAGADYELGEYVVDVGSGDTLDLKLVTVPKAMRPAGVVFVPGNPRAQLGPFWIDRCEVTNRAYLEFLQSLPATQREEFLPRDGWRDGRPISGELDAPVRSIRLSDAISYARWKGGHLPSLEEFQAAGRLGGNWPYPWGTKSDEARVVADPHKLSGPRPVGERTSGASRCGVHDLLGNVAEWVLGPSGSWLVAGGSYESNPSDVNLDRAVKRPPLERHRDVGFRVAYNVPTRAYDRVGLGLESRWLSRQELGQFQTQSTADYSTGARPRVLLRVAGNVLRLSGLSEGMAIQMPGGRGYFGDDGWKPTGTTELVLSLLNTYVDVREFGAKFDEVVRRKKGIFDLVLETSAVPRSLVSAIGGGRYVHRFPILHRPGLASQHRVVLPGSSRVVNASRDEYESKLENGLRVVTFEVDTPPSERVAVEPIEVEFVMDEQGTPLPDARELEARAQEFFDAWNEAQTSQDGTDRLMALQDPSFCYGPDAIQAAELRLCMRKWGRLVASGDPFQIEDAKLARLRFGKARVLSISGLADTIQCDLEVDVDGAERPELIRTRWIPKLENGERLWRIYDLRSPTRMDTCRQSATEFVSSELGVRIAIPDEFTARRLVQHPTRVQLRFDLRNPEVLRSVATGRSQNANLSILVLGDKLESGERADDFYERATRHVWPLWSRRTWSGGPSEARVGSGLAERRQYLLSRPRLDGDGIEVLVQQTVRARAGSSAVLIVAVVRCDGPDASLFQEVWDKKLGPVFDRFLRGFEFQR